MTSRLALPLSLIIAFTLSAASTVHAQQTTDQQKCTNALNKNWSKVSKDVSKQIEGCIKNFAKGKALNKDNPAIDTIEECLSDDPKGKIGKKKDKTGSDFDKHCQGLGFPDFGATDPNTVNDAAMTKELDLFNDIFGSDVPLESIIIAEDDPSFVDPKDAKDSAKCQQQVVKAAFKCQQIKQTEFNKCKKLGLKDGSITDADGLAACYEGAKPDKIFKKCLDPDKGIQKFVQKKCADKVDEKTLSELFPGCLTDDVSSLAGCVDRIVECRFCRSANAADGLDRNCDLFDDGVANASCGALIDVCEPLNPIDCLLPYPSSFFLQSASTATGLQINFPDEGLPSLTPPLVADPWNELDGFSPMAPMIMHFQQGVDLAASDAARLLPVQGVSPPWIDGSRSFTDHSQDANSPSVLIKASTGERILHFLEVDSRESDPSEAVLFMRPGVSLEPGTRYIVAMRNLKDPNGNDVVAEANFAALRDATPTTLANVEARRPYYEASIFPQLISAGVTRNDLVLAYDFTTQSESQLTRQMIAMRDQGIAYADAIEADPNANPFTVTGETILNDCNDPNAVLWKHVEGTFTTPLFLTEVPLLAGGSVPQHSVDANDIPVQNGTMEADFDVSIPCSHHDPNVDKHTMVMGHGIFGTSASMVLGVPPNIGEVVDWNYVSGGTKWIGLSDGITGQIWVGGSIVGLAEDDSHLNDFPAFVDRLRQGMANQIVLARLMKKGVPNRDPAFDDAFPGPGSEMFYHGISLGGIMGTYFAGLTPDVDRFSVDVPAASFACLLQRSTQFSLFEALLPPVGLSVGREQAIGVGALIHELWVSGEPASLLRHVTTDPLPGAGGSSKLLMTVGWLDKQVSNTCTEIAARTMGVSSLGSVQQGLVGIPDVAGPVSDSAMTIYDTGFFDFFNPLHVPNIPPLTNQIPTNVCDPHNGPRSTPAEKMQIVDFLKPGGVITNFCTGTCDAVDVIESPSFTCDPS